MRYPACCGRSVVEILESRKLLSSTFPNINISRLAGNQAEGSITVDRVDPSKMFAVSNIDVGDGLMAATSSDGGATWSQRLIATDTDGLPPACCDCSAAFDSLGNLFVSYLNSKDNQVELLLSTDAGHSFSLLQQYSGSVDQPTVVTGPGSVWVEFDRGPGVAVAGAPVTGLGTVGSFAPLQEVRGSGFGQFGDVAVNSAGQVMVTYQKDIGPHQSLVFVNFDSTGVGGKFGAPIRVTSTYVPSFDFIPAQNTRGIDAETGLAFDQSGGPFNGRLYLVYTNQIPANTDNTDIYIRYSDNNGATWSAPIRVNDDTGANSQFLPRISLDNTSGQVAVSWYDARNDLGTGGTGDTDQMTDDDVQFYAAVITPAVNGLFVSPNQQISVGTSNSFDANSTVDLGDYSGLDFYDGTLHPLWFDNSNSTGDNPNGKLNQLNAYTASASASTFSQGAEISIGGLVASLTPGAGLNVGYIRVGGFYTVTVSYSVGTDASTLSSSNLLVTGPNGFSQPAQLVRISAPRNRPIVATYRVSNPTGNWAAADVGTYSILLQPNSVADTTRAPATAGILGNFVVATGLTAGSRAGGTGPKYHHRSPGD